MKFNNLPGRRVLELGIQVNARLWNYTKHKYFMHQIPSPIFVRRLVRSLTNSSSECHLSIISSIGWLVVAIAILVVADLWLTHGNPGFHGNLGLPLIVDVVSLLLQRVCGFFTSVLFLTDIQLVKKFCRFSWSPSIVPPLFEDFQATSYLLRTPGYQSSFLLDSRLPIIWWGL